MSKPIWSRRDLIPLDFRILFWMIDAGMMEGALARGWMQICAIDLRVHRITLNRRLKKLTASGVLILEGKGFYSFNAEAFESAVDEERVTTRKVKIHDGLGISGRKRVDDSADEKTDKGVVKRTGVLVR